MAMLIPYLYLIGAAFGAGEGMPATLHENWRDYTPLSVASMALDRFGPKVLRRMI